MPFHTVGVLPFALGGVLAWGQGGALRWDVCSWGTLGVELVMLATYYAGEHWDYHEDRKGWTLSLSTGWPPSCFAGGSRVLQRGLQQFGRRTGPWSLLLGLTGLAGGFFCSTRPVRWVSTGLGELWIAFRYGWLPGACLGQSGRLSSGRRLLLCGCLRWRAALQ